MLWKFPSSKNVELIGSTVEYTKVLIMDSTQSIK